MQIQKLLLQNTLFNQIIKKYSVPVIRLGILQYNDISNMDYYNWQGGKPPILIKMI